MSLPRPLLPAAAVATLLVVAAGCGGSGGMTGPTASPPRDESIALDFTPNAIHAPLYVAAADGADTRRNFKLRIRPPGEGPDGLKLLATGKVDFAVVDINDLALARRQGVDAVGVAALVQKPLAALVGDPALKRPRDLAGKTVGVSGLPSDPAFLKAIVEADGGDYRRIKQVTIGFNAVGALLAKKVAAVPVFWSAEGVALRQRGRRTSEFRVDRYGAPAYPEVVLATTLETARDQPDSVRRVLRALAEGVRTTQADPATAARLVARAGNADLALTRAQLDAVSPLFSPPMRLDRRVLDRWADFATRIGLLPKRPDVGRSFVFGLAPGRG